MPHPTVSASLPPHTLHPQSASAVCQSKSALRRTREEVVLTEKRESCAEFGQREEQGGELSADLGGVEGDGPQAL